MEHRINSIESTLASNEQVFIRLLSIYYPFTTDQIKKYWAILEKGDAHYSIFLEDAEGYVTPKYGMCFNSHIEWNDNMRSRWLNNCGLYDPARCKIVGCGAPQEPYDVDGAHKMVEQLPLSLEEERLKFVSAVTTVPPDDADNYMEYPCYDDVIPEYTQQYPAMGSDRLEALINTKKMVVFLNPSIWDNTIAPNISPSFVENFLENTLKRNM